MGQWQYRESKLMILIPNFPLLRISFFLIALTSTSITSTITTAASLVASSKLYSKAVSDMKNSLIDNTRNNRNESYVNRILINYVDEVFSETDRLNIMPGLLKIEPRIKGVGRNTSTITTTTSTPMSRLFDMGRDHNNNGNCKIEKNSVGRNLDDNIKDYFYNRWDQYTRNHVLTVNVSEASRLLKPTGKSSFMAGFGVGFLMFALKKLLLPVVLGAQIVKSILIAMFLPSILGSLGKLLGKGLSSVSGLSGSSGGLGGGAQTVEDFEFKDTSPYGTGVDEQTYDAKDNGLSSSESPEAMNRFGFVDNNHDSFNHHRPHLSDNNYYMSGRQPTKKTDYKVFHKIPPSSLLLTSYDPFYSPLLSRLDSVFQQLGLSESKSYPEMEKCRERLVCMMYANPAKYAPYSNLVSAQLSRELNELRKPTTDNPEILRFFKYMKAAKDGQDGEECLAHTGCSILNAQDTSPAMLTTFKDINKLVQARKFTNN